MNKNKVEKIFSLLLEQNPNPETELEFKNEFTLLVAIILSAQATDKSVNKATKSLFEEVDTPKAMLALGEDGLKTYIKTIGLFNSKAKNVIKLSEVLINSYNSKIPETREELMELPGVGRKTANVFLNCARGKRYIAVDTHVFRVANRIGLTHAKTPLQSEEQLMNIVPDKYLQEAHHLLILHGRYVCIARKPKCRECIIQELCEYREKNL